MIVVRNAFISDCLSLARVQVDSYRTAYAGFFPKAYLDHFTYEEQKQDWRDLLASDSSDILLVAETKDKQIIGYVLARAQPDIYPGYDSEIIALHVRRANQRQGVGNALLRKSAEMLIELGCKSTMLWTLQSNPVRHWYESLGGLYLGEKHSQLDDWDIVEVAYGWERILLFFEVLDGE